MPNSEVWCWLPMSTGSHAAFCSWHVKPPRTVSSHSQLCFTGFSPKQPQVQRYASRCISTELQESSQRDPNVALTFITSLKVIQDQSESNSERGKDRNLCLSEEAGVTPLLDKIQSSEDCDWLVVQEGDKRVILRVGFIITNAVKRLITHKIKVFVYIIYMCVLCMFIMYI